MWLVIDHLCYFTVLGTDMIHYRRAFETNYLYIWLRLYPQLTCTSINAYTYLSISELLHALPPELLSLCVA